MTQIPIQKEVIDKIAAENKIKNPGKASIREMRKMIQDVEKETGVRFVKMEMGIPGLPAPQVGVQAQIEALKSGVASIYPEIYGTADFKKEAARFVKNFLDIDVTPDCCVPTVGSMQAGFASFLTLTRYDAKKTKVLFIDPGFPVQKQQCRVLGIPMKAFDVYEYRGDKLRDKLEEELKADYRRDVAEVWRGRHGGLCLFPDGLPQGLQRSRQGTFPADSCKIYRPLCYHDKRLEVVQLCW